MWQVGMEGSGLEPFRSVQNVLSMVHFMYCFSLCSLLSPLGLRRYQGAGVLPPVALLSKRDIEGQKPALNKI